MTVREATTPQRAGREIVWRMLFGGLIALILLASLLLICPSEPETSELDWGPFRTLIS